MSKERARYRAWILFGLAIGAGAAIATMLNRPRVKIGPKTRMLLIGDSMAEGLTPHLAALAKEASVPFAASSKIGSHIPEWLGQRLDDALAKANPTLVLVALGTNDFYSHEPNEKLAADADALLERLSQATVPDCYGLGPDLVWIGPPLLQIFDAPYPVLQGAVESGYKAACGEAEYFSSELLDLRMGPDLIHPTAAGFAAWAGAIWKRLS
jgi:lysophospholipase L1-like esterase